MGDPEDLHRDPRRPRRPGARPHLQGLPAQEAVAPAAGALEALRRADEAVGVIHRFVEGRDDTLTAMAADSDAGGLQALSGSEAPEGEPVAATTEGGILLGQQGRHGDVSMSAPDAQGASHPFGIAHVGYDDVAGGTLLRAAGLGADEVEPLMDSTEAHKPMHETMFGPRPSQRAAQSVRILHVSTGTRGLARGFSFVGARVRSLPFLNLSSLNLIP